MQTAKNFLKDYILDNRLTHITAQEVVELASDPENPMHRHFQWDDAKAGYQYRLWQARQLLASIKITVENKPDTEVRLLVSVPTDRGENGYQLLVEAVKNPAAREALKTEITFWVEFWRSQAALLDTAMLAWLNRFPAAGDKAAAKQAGKPAKGRKGAGPAVTPHLNKKPRQPRPQPGA